MPSLKTVVGTLVEVFGADLFNVVGLAVQKVAVMKIIETNRLKSASRTGAEVEPDGFDFGGADLTPLLEETNSEVMTVDEEDEEEEAAGQEPGSVNDTQVPDLMDLLRSPIWVMGLMVFIVGNLLEMVALSLASQTDVSLLTNFALVWNAVVSVVVFKEDFNVWPVHRECTLQLFKRWDLVHCFILLVGSMMAVMFTPEVPEDNLDSKELLHRWAAPPYVYWGAFMLVTMMLTAVFLVKNWRNLKTGNLNAALIAGLCGFMSAFCVTLSKVATTLISSTIKGSHELGSPEAVFLVALWIVVLVSQLFLLNVALGAFEQGMIIPIYEIVGTIAAIVSGILFYRTYEEFTMEKWSGFGVGVVLMSWGVWLVAHREVHTQQELSNNLYSNLSMVDDLLRVTNFSSSLSAERQHPFYTSQSAALDGFEASQYHAPLDASMRSLYTSSDESKPAGAAAAERGDEQEQRAPREQEAREQEDTEVYEYSSWGRS